jgi:hypothetical protein
MIFQIDIDDADLAYLLAGLRHGSITPNRYSKEDGARIGRLIENGIIKQDPYYGEQMCYHPSYSLTKLGKKVKEHADKLSNEPHPYDSHSPRPY